MPVLKLWDGARWHYGAAGDSDAEDEEGCKLLGWISPSANDQWHDVLALLCKAMHRKAPDIIFTFEDPSDFSDGALTRPPKADGVWPTDKLFRDVVNGEDWYELMLNCQRWMDAEQLDTVTLNGDSAPCLNVSVWRMYDRACACAVSRVTGLYNRVIGLQKRQPDDADSDGYEPEADDTGAIVTGAVRWPDDDKDLQRLSSQANHFQVSDMFVCCEVLGTNTLLTAPASSAASAGSMTVCTGGRTPLTMQIWGALTETEQAALWRSNGMTEEGKNDLSLSPPGTLLWARPLRKEGKPTVGNCSYRDCLELAPKARWPYLCSLCGKNTVDEKCCQASFSKLPADTQAADIIKRAVGLGQGGSGNQGPPYRVCSNCLKGEVKSYTSSKAGQASPSKRGGAQGASHASPPPKKRKGAVLPTHACF